MTVTIELRIVSCIAAVILLSSCSLETMEAIGGTAVEGRMADYSSEFCQAQRSHERISCANLPPDRCSNRVLFPNCF